MDAKDILGLTKNQLPIPRDKKSRQPKDSQRKPNGISREVYALIGGLAPLMPAIDASQLKKRPPSDEKLRVYLRTYALDQTVQDVSSSARLRTIKRIEQALQELGVNLKPEVPTKAVCAEHRELRKEILTLLNLQKQLQYKEVEDTSVNDSPYMETLAAPKDRAFMPESIAFIGGRPVKKDHKHKGSFGQSPLQSKRPRKMKDPDL